MMPGGVSIHAPARGATARPSSSRPWRRSFDPRSRAGSDLTATTWVGRACAFRSTLPRGERPGGDGVSRAGLGVSIHAPARGATRRQRAPRPHARRTVSIHAPARGATPASRYAPGRDAGFDPRSRAGSDAGSAARRSPPACFDPRSRAGSDRPRPRPWCGAAGFDPRSRAGSDVYDVHRRGTGDSFDPRSRAGSDLGAFVWDIGLGVSIHAPARGATGPAARRLQVAPGFDPRSRAGSDRRHRQAVRHGPVSIHAPARGATIQRPRFGVASGVSIHAPARGATPPRRCPRPCRRRFDPRSRAGSDLEGGRDATPEAGVSIHAPARGATLAQDFSARPLLFRSTLPRGERPHRAHSSAAVMQVSIHAPARGATSCQKHMPKIARVSIHAPARGATRSCAPTCRRRRRFDPRSRAGSDVLFPFFFAISSRFRSTLPRGERRHRPPTADWRL